MGGNRLERPFECVSDVAEVGFKERVPDGEGNEGRRRGFIHSFVDDLFGVRKREQTVHRPHTPTVYRDAELRHGAVCNGYGNGLPARLRVHPPVGDSRSQRDDFSFGNRVIHGARFHVESIRCTIGSS